MGEDRAVLGVDPGRAKAGLALVDPSGAVILAEIVAVGELRARLDAVLAGRSVAAVALGRGTSSAAVARELHGVRAPIVLVDEFETTREARRLYFQEHPPRGWRRLVPVGLQVPPRPVDDYAAILIARRFLGREGGLGAPR